MPGLASGELIVITEVPRKGDTSGDRQFVREGYYDCDGDTLLFKVEQEGNGACHTGNHTCFDARLLPAAIGTRDQGRRL